jgi:hypothetical protein
MKKDTNEIKNIVSAIDNLNLNILKIVSPKVWLLLTVV